MAVDLTKIKSDAEIAKIKKIGDKQIKDGKIMDYFLKVAHIFHYKDDPILKIGILSGIQHAIKDYHRGIYLNVTGTAGKGKTDALEVLQGLMPDHWIYKTSISPKVLYYADAENHINKSNIIFDDDIELESGDLVQTLKKVCSKYSEVSRHFTITDKKSVEMSVRSKYSFWFTSVASLQDDQLSSRFVNIAVNEGKDRDEKVAHMIGKNIGTRTASMAQYDNVNVCKYIFQKLCSEEYGILIPYYSIIRFDNPNDSRLIASFYSVLQCVTFLNRFQREIKDDSIVSEIEDFNMTVSIIKPIYNTNRTKLSNPELKIKKLIEEANKPITQAEIQQKIKRSAGTISKNLTNILEKAPNISMETTAYGIKHYFVTNASKVDMNEFMPPDKLADIYLDLDKYNEAVDGFWRMRGE